MIRAVIFTLVIGLSAGCTRKVYTPVELDNRHVEVRYVHTRDSIFVRDSVHIRERGDTVYVDRFRYVYRDHYLKDTVYVRDSVSVPVYVERIQHERYVPRFFRWCFGIAVVSAGWVVWRIVRK